MPPTMGGRHAPEIAVVVPSHDRPLRLRWLLNALEEQSLDRGRFEVIVAHDSSGPESADLLDTHPLASAGVLKQIALPPGSAPPGANRNAGWRAVRAPLVAFTDDDCRPPSDWLERALEAGLKNPGAIIQGRTAPDPEELRLLHAPHWHTQRITPPAIHAQACNIVYPRDLLERVGGFDDELFTGEDTDLSMRAQRAGALFVAAPEVVTYHAVVALSLGQRLRSAWRWQDLPEVVSRHPELRRHFPLWIFWKPTHAWLPFALAGASLGRRNRLLQLLALPYLVHALPQHGTDPRGRLRALGELPGHAIVDLAEVAALARGSLRSRTLFL